MKAALVIAVLAAVCGVLYAGDSYARQGYGGRGRFPGYSATQTSVARGQLYVNDVARKIGTGVGTADYYGVPGTYYSANRGYGYGGYDGYNRNGYGYGRNDGYGYNGAYGSNDGYHGDNYY